MPSTLAEFLRAYYPQLGIGLGGLLLLLTVLVFLLRSLRDRAGEDQRHGEPEPEAAVHGGDGGGSKAGMPVRYAPRTRVWMSLVPS